MQPALQLREAFWMGSFETNTYIPIYHPPIERQYGHLVLCSLRGVVRGLC